jgi:protease-4
MKMALSLLLLALASQGFPQDYTVMSVATTDDALVMFGNPAGLAAGRLPNAGLFYTDGENSAARLGIAMVTPALGLAYGHWSEAFERRLVSSAVSAPVGGSVSLGARGRWLKVAPGSYFALDLGLLYRPVRFVSIGAVVNNVNRPGIDALTFERDYRLGLGLRPMTDRLTLFGEWSVEENEDIDESRYRFGVEAEPVDGIVFKGSLDRDLTFKAGVLLNFTNAGMGYTATVDTGNGLVENSFQVSSSSERNRSFMTAAGEIAEIRISGRIEDSPPGFSLLGGSAASLEKVTSQLRKAREDRAVVGLLLNIKTFEAGSGTVFEIRREVELVRESGKKVVAYLEQGGMDLALYLASAADRVVVCPSSEVIVKGPHAEVMMLKGLLDKLGVEADVIRAGEYKSAVEPLTREELSPEAREQLQELVDGMFDEVTAGIFRARNIPPQEMTRILDRGISRPDQAKEVGIVDEVGYYDDAKLAMAKLVKKKVYDPDRVKTVSLCDRVYRQYSWVSPPKVAVLLASGSIVTGESRTDFLYGSQYMGSETMVRHLKHLKADRSIKAVVLRIDSPGGDGLASDLIWREVNKFKESGKPIVVSMSDVAASGGYFIACCADRIFADPTTITGSIGVFGGKAVLAGTYEKLGINPEIIKSTEHSDAFSPARKFTDDERRVFKEHIDYYYEDFVSKVAEGRNLAKEDVFKLAEGRVYTGTRALELGLIDEIGTLEDAIEEAAKRAGVREKPRVVYIRRDTGFLGRMSGCGISNGLLGSEGGSWRRTRM